MKDVDEYIKDYLKTNNIERNNENFAALYMAWGNACFKQCENLEYENEKLKAENAALKERLEKVVEPPCKIGDILYTVTIVFSDGWVGDTILRRNGFSISETEVTEKNIWSICDLIRRGMAFFSKEAAETRLRELQDNGTD